MPPLAAAFRHSELKLTLHTQLLRRRDMFSLLSEEKAFLCCINEDRQRDAFRLTDALPLNAAFAPCRRLHHPPYASD